MSGGGGMGQGSMGQMGGGMGGMGQGSMGGGMGQMGGGMGGGAAQKSAKELNLTRINNSDVFLESTE
eukprot:scaffold1866_cov135-Skeletonema_marinoi.AAC.1